MKTWGDYASHTPATVSNTDLISAYGRHHIMSITLGDTPTEGTWKLTLNGSTSDALAYNETSANIAIAVDAIMPGDALSWSNGGTYPGSYNLESPTNIADPGTFTGADDTPMRKAVPQCDVVTTQQGAPLPDPPVADFSGTPTSGTNPLSVDFSDLSTGFSDSWSWEKSSDGGSNWVEFSTTQNPSAQPFTTGTWAIRLTATNEGGSDSETKLAYIVVIAEEPPAESTPTIRLELPPPPEPKFTGRLSGNVSYSDGTSDTFESTIDDDGNVSAIGFDAIQEVLAGTTWLNDMFALISPTLSLHPPLVSHKMVIEASMQFYGRISRVDGTWEDFAVQYDRKIGAYVLNSSGHGTGEVDAYDEFLSTTLTTWFDTLVGDGESNT